MLSDYKTLNPLQAANAPLDMIAYRRAFAKSLTCFDKMPAPLPVPVLRISFVTITPASGQQSDLPGDAASKDEHAKKSAQPLSYFEISESADYFGFDDFGFSLAAGLLFSVGDFAGVLAFFAGGLAGALACHAVRFLAVATKSNVWSPNVLIATPVKISP